MLHCDMTASPNYRMPVPGVSSLNLAALGLPSGGLFHEAFQPRIS